MVSITEILKNPMGKEEDIPGGESHEFIEFYNIGSDTLFIENLFITDGNEVDSIIPWYKKIDYHQNCCFNRDYLLPEQFALILDRDYEKAPSNSLFKIKDSTLILTVNSSGIVGGLTQTKGLFLYSGTSKTVKDSLAAFHDPENKVIFGMKITNTQPIHCKEGFSLIPDHLILPTFSIIENPDTLSLGTYEFLYDKWICEYTLTNSDNISKDIACLFYILQTGEKYPQNIDWLITKGPGKKTDTEIMFEGSLPYLPYPIQLDFNLPRDAVMYTFTLIDNNSKTSIPIDISSVLLPLSPIKINEIYPRGNSSIPEWIELLNTSHMPINLKNWRFGLPDNIDTISSSDLILNPGGFLVLTKDISLFTLLFPSVVQCVQPFDWPALYDYNDTVVIYNHLDTVPCEIVYYESDWFESWNSQSIARIFIDKNGLKRSTWTLSRKPSPGFKNPEISWQSTANPTLDINPIPFTPNGDGKDDILDIKITIPTTSRISIDIYGFNGEILYEFTNQIEDEMKWDGKTSSGNPAPVGPFFVVGTIKNGAKEKLIRKKGILWR